MTNYNCWYRVDSPIQRYRWFARSTSPANHNGIRYAAFNWMRDNSEIVWC